ncbi:MAG: sensor histidine kinase [Burkholderiales bacterium]
MIFLPRSLFGRIALILVGGFVAVQLLTTAIHMADREAQALRNGVNQAVARIGDSVRVLRAAGEAARPTFLGATAGEYLRFRTATSVAGQTQATPDPELLAAAREALALELDPGVGFRVIDVRAIYQEPDSWLARKFIERLGVQIQAAVELGRGDWIEIESIHPPRASRWFSRLVQSLVIVDSVMLLLAFFAVRLATRPLTVLARAAEDLGRDIHRPPLEESGATELVRASRALNTMQDRLKRYVETRIESLAAMSHDLKTPITRMRLRAEMLEDPEIKTRFARDLDAMQEMVSSALETMRGLSEGGEASHPIDIGALLSSLKQDAEEAGHQVSVSGPPVQPLIGRAQALKRCLQNLLDNALAYGQRADITVREESQALSICIADHGPGIPDAEMEKVFDPFYRLESSRNRNTGGTGLGLSIARNIAQSHGGSVRLRNRSEGGLEATLVLPRNS